MNFLIFTVSIEIAGAGYQTKQQIKAALLSQFFFSKHYNLEDC